MLGLQTQEALMAPPQFNDPGANVEARCAKSHKALPIHMLNIL